MAIAHPLAPLRTHQAYSLVEPLEDYLGIRRDFIVYTELFSLVSGKMMMPINLEVITNTLGLDLCLADRLLTLLPDAVCHVDTFHQFLAEERNGFEARAVLLVRRWDRNRHRDITVAMARSIDRSCFAPSVWHFCDHNHSPFLVAPTLRLVTKQVSRKLEGFATSYASRPGDLAARDRLREVLGTLATRPNYPCAFRSEFLGKVEPLAMLICERLLQVFANLRRIICDFRNSDPTITIADYQAVRSLLLHLPLAPVDRTLSAHAIGTAETVFGQIESDNHQLSLPDRSGEGHSWFTRNDVLRWTSYGYTTVKKHLQELEDDGVLISTVAENNRDHGRQIHFHFAEGRAPPFAWANPYEGLPDID